MDNISVSERSHVMSLVKSKNTKPELAVRKFLHAQGLRFRLHNRRLPGKPDIVLKKYQTVILIHGCFWHGHKFKGCKLARVPKSNVEFWRNKITLNSVRDEKNKRALRKLGWCVIEVWECQLKNVSTYYSLIEKIAEKNKPFGSNLKRI